MESPSQGTSRDVTESDIFSTLFDPLYHLSSASTTTPDGTLWKLLDPRERERLNLFRRLIGTIELQRLKALRQSGFVGWVFPSATHTRFSHSIGSWLLGRIATDVVHVRSVEGVVSLRVYLERMNDLEEFLVSLLVHDVGHLPFSHVLEANRDFVSLANSSMGIPQGRSPHEEVHRFLACQLLGENDSRLRGPFLAALMLRHEEETSHAVRTIAGILHEYHEDSHSASARLVADLCDIRILLGCDASCDAKLATSESHAVHSLVEILDRTLDLDRIDYYGREAFFTGVGQPAIHVMGLLRHLHLDMTCKPAIVAVSQSGVWHAIELLMLRDSLEKEVFDNPQVRAYEAMLSLCLSMASRAGAVSLDPILGADDDSFLHYLSGIPSISGLVERICKRRPYTHLMTLDLPSTEAGHQVASDFEKWVLNRRDQDVPGFVLGLPRTWGRKRRGWLECLRVLDSRRPDASTVRDLEQNICAHLDREAARRDQRAFVFSREPQVSEGDLEDLSAFFHSRGVHQS